MPGFLERLSQELDVGRPTSGYRDPKTQDDLFKAGKTPVRGGQSSHNRGSEDMPGAIDIGGVNRSQESAVRASVERTTGRKVAKIIWETGRGKNQGTGPHFHIEFADGATGSVPEGGKLRVIEPWADPAMVKATPQEKAAMAEPRQAVQDVFAPETTQEVTGSYQQSDDRLSVADQLLSQFIGESSQVREQQEQALARTVETKRGINDQLRTEVQRLTEYATPVWQEREALANRMLELDNMNPLEAGIRGMFDPNYNRNNLRARIRTQDEALGYLESIFQDKQQYGQVLSNLAQADYNDSAAVADLVLQNGGEDVRLALQSFNLATQDLDLILKGVQTDTALTAAKNQARADLLSGMSTGQINEALTQAQGNGGVAIVNGVELRQGELEDAQTRLRSQDISLRLQQLALQRGEIDLIEANQENILKTMNIADVQRAVADGYTFKGVQLDPVSVGARLQELQRTQASVVAQDSLKTAGGVVSSMLNQYAGIHRATAARFAGLFGQVPEEFTRASTADQAQINAFTKGLEQAKISGTVEEYLATQVPVIQALVDGQRKIVEASVNRWAGGNKDLAAVGTAWMTGQPLDSGAAMKGLIHMARNGVPAGTRFTGTAGRVFNVVQQTVKRWDSQAGSGGGLPTLDEITNDRGGTVKEKEAQLLQELRGQIAKVYNQTLGDNMFRSIPGVAAKVKVDGKPHPFSQISPAEWNQAVQMGDRAGLESTAQAYNMKPGDLQAMLEQGPGGELWKAVSAGKSGPDASWPTLMSRLQANQLQQMMSYLDVNEASTGFVPSQYLRDLVNRPEFRSEIMNGDTRESNSSFGGFISSMAAGSGYQQEVSNLIDSIDAAYVTKNAAVMETRRRKAQGLMGQPVEVARFILGSINGLAPGEEQLLLGEIRTRFGKMSHSVGASPTSTDFDQMRAIDAWIMSGESQDPRVNNALKVARKQWDKLSPPIQTGLGKYFGGM